MAAKNGSGRGGGEKKFPQKMVDPITFFFSQKAS